MCSFCERKEIIKKSPDLLNKAGTSISLRIHEEDTAYMLRMEIGSLGYTLPIFAKFCMFCGEKIKESE